MAVTVNKFDSYAAKTNNQTTDFEALFQEHWSRVYAVIYRIVGDPDEAEDLALVFLISGYVPTNVLGGISLLWMNGILMLSLSFLGGSYLSTLANGVLAFGLFDVAFVGGWVEYVGWFTKNQVAVNVGIISSLIIPSEALWKRAAHIMESPLVAAIGFSPFTSASPPSPAMVWFAIGVYR